MNRARIAELERRHKALEEEIAEALLHRSADDLMVAELKRRKLNIRDEIEQLRDENRTRATLIYLLMDQGDRLVIGRMGRAPLRQNALESYFFDDRFHLETRRS